MPFLKGFLTATFIGSVVAFIYASGSKNTQRPDPEEVVKHLQAQFQNLYDSEIVQYGDLLEREARFRKANDVIEKLMGILSEDLALRFEPVGKQRLMETIKKAKATKDDARLVSEPAQEKEGITAEPQQGAQDLQLSQLRDREARWTADRIQRQPQKFLQAVQIKNMDNLSKQKQELGIKIWRNLRGKLKGTITFFDSGKTAWGLKLDTDVRVASAGTRGKVQIELLKNEAVFSSSKSEGKPQGIYTYGHGTRSIIVDGMEGQLRIQLYRLQDGAWIGNVYTVEAGGRFQRTGTVVLGHQ